MNGILLIDKPQGWTSHDVVGRVRSQLRPIWQERYADDPRKFRVGHAGTLDPMATGLLLVLVGAATKQQDSFMGLDKCYTAEITLGASSTTDDAEGVISTQEDSSSPPPSEETVVDTLTRFEGEIEQIPPQHSAIKIDGRRAYKSARNGQWVEIPPRRVRVQEFMDFTYEYPKINFTVCVSSGTYIRSLARDIGAELDVGGYLSALRRISIGTYRVEDAVDPKASAEQLTGAIFDL